MLFTVTLPFNIISYEVLKALLNKAKIKLIFCVKHEVAGYVRSLITNSVKLSF
jgi:hypothetical protein